MTQRSAARAMGGAVLSGWHELPVTKTPQRRTRELLADAVRGALAHAGLAPQDVDGFAVGGFTLPPDHAVDLAVRCGLRVRWLGPQDPGGAGAINAVLAAARAVLAGDADTVVCAAADTTSPAQLAQLNATFSTTFTEALTPVGAASAPVVFAFLQHEFQQRTGTRRDDLGRIVVAQRRNGSRNPAALFRTPLTLADYLAAPPVAEPIGLYDCVYPGSGAAAVVVTTTDRVRRTDHRVAHLRAGFCVHGWSDPTALTFGWSRHAAELYEAAGAGPSDLSTLELYDDFPVMVAAQLDELGFLDDGGLERFVAGSALDITGTYPLNTGGGMLSGGQAGGAGGYLPLVQGARQVTGQGRRTQVRGAHASLVTGLGMIDQHGPQSVGALVLSSTAAEAA